MAHGAKTEMNKTIKLWIEGRIWGRPNHLEPIQCSLQNDFQSLVRLNVISQHLAVDDCNVDTASPGAISKFQWVHYHLRFWEGGSELGHTCFKSPKPHKKKKFEPPPKKINRWHVAFAAKYPYGFKRSKALLTCGQTRSRPSTFSNNAIRRDWCLNIEYLTWCNE